MNKSDGKTFFISISAGILLIIITEVLHFFVPTVPGLIRLFISAITYLVQNINAEVQLRLWMLSLLILLILYFLLISILMLVQFNRRIIRKKVYKPSEEEKKLLQAVIESDIYLGSIEKFKLLSKNDQGYLFKDLLNQLDSLARYSQRESIAHFLAEVANVSTTIFDKNVLNNVLRKFSLISDHKIKSEFMNHIQNDILKKASKSIRKIFFKEIIEMLNSNNFDVQNIVCPAIVQIHEAIPKKLQRDYITSLINLTSSSAFYAKPAANRAFEELPKNLCRSFFEVLNEENIYKLRKKRVQRLYSVYEKTCPIFQKRKIKELLKAK